MSGMSDLIAVHAIYMRNEASEECAHILFPEVSESPAARDTVVSLMASLAAVAYSPGLSDEELGKAAEHSLILAVAIGMALGKVAASEELAEEFTLPDSFEVTDWN